MHFSQISRYGWRFLGSIPEPSNLAVWNIALRLFVETISDEIHCSEKRRAVNLKKLSRFNIIELLLHSENHRRLIIPNLIHKCENYNSNDRTWQIILENFAKSSLLNCTVYYNFTPKTNHGLIDGIIYLSTTKTAQFETELFYADSGMLELIGLENINKFITVLIASR